MEHRPITQEKTIQQLYLDSLTPKEKQAYEIAKEHLGMSFQLEKSIGFITFKKNRSNNKN